MRQTSQYIDCSAEVTLTDHIIVVILFNAYDVQS